MKTLLKLILLSTLILNVACKEATEEVEEVKVAICLDEQTYLINEDQDRLDYSICEEVYSKDDVDKLTTSCQGDLIVDDSTCEDYFAENQDVAKCIIGDRAKVYYGNFILAGADEGQKANFLSDAQAYCIDVLQGAWAVGQFD